MDENLSTTQTSMQSAPPTPSVQSKPKNFIVLILSVLLVILLGVTVYFVFQNTRLQEKIKQVKNEDATLKARLEDLEKIVSEAASEKEEVERKTCKGVWKEGVCIKATCIDSDVNEKPNDIYIKGSVTYTNDKDIETVVYDECTGSKTQVNEMWCYESPAGSENYVQGKMVYNCKKGCLDGACIK